MNKNVALLALAVFFLAFAGAWLALLIRHGVPHSTADDIVIGGCLLMGAMLAAPTDMKDAINTMRPVLPWNRKSDSGPSIGGDSH